MLIAFSVAPTVTDNPDAEMADAVTEVHLASGPAPRPLAALPLVESLEAVPG